MLWNEIYNLTFYRFINLFINFSVIIFISRSYGIEDLATFNIFISIITPLLIFSFFDLNTKIITKKNFQLYMETFYFPIILSILIFIFSIYFLSFLNIIIFGIVIFYKINDNLYEANLTCLRKEIKTKLVLIYALIKLLVFFLILTTSFFLKLSFVNFLILLTSIFFLLNLIISQKIISKKINFKYRDYLNIKKYVKHNFSLGISILIKNLNTYILRYILIIYFSSMIYGLNIPIFYLINFFGTLAILCENLIIPNLLKNKLIFDKKLKKIIVVLIIIHIVLILTYNHWVIYYFKIFKINLSNDLKLAGLIICLTLPAFTFRAIFKSFSFYFSLEKWQMKIQLFSIISFFLIFFLLNFNKSFINVYYSFLISNYLTLTFYIYLFYGKKNKSSENIK